MPKFAHGQLVITNDGHFASSIVETKTRSISYQVSSYLLGRKNLYVLDTNKTKFCVYADVAKSGYLEKKGSWFKSFKRRYFLLRNDIGVLSYYDSDQTLDSPLGTIYINKQTTVTPINAPSLKQKQSSNFTYLFLVRTPAFTTYVGENCEPQTISAAEITLGAKSELERQAWVHDLTYETAPSSHEHKHLREGEMNAEIDWWDILFTSNNLAKTTGQSHRRRREVKNVASLMTAIDETPTSPSSSAAATDGATDNNNADGGDCEYEVPSVVEPSSELEEAGLEKSMLDISLNLEAAGELINQIYDEENEEGGSDGGLSGGTEGRPTSSRIQGDSDDEPEEDFDLNRFRSKTMRDFDGKGLSASKKDKYKHERKMSDKVTKFKMCKKSKVRDMPSTHTSFEKYVVPVKPENPDGPKMVKGIQICLEINNIAYNGNRLFAVVVGNSHANSTMTTAAAAVAAAEVNSNSSSSSKRNTKQRSGAGAGAGFKELCRTENVVVDGSVSYGMPISKCQVHFCAMLAVIPDYVKHVCVAIFNAESTDSQTTTDLSQSLCHLTFSRNYLNQRVFYAPMKVPFTGTHTDLTNPTLLDKSAKLGIVQIESKELYNMRERVCRIMPHKPYGEQLFSFRSAAGAVLTNEHLFASVYSVEASKKLIQIVIDEREAILAAIIKRVELEVEEMREQARCWKSEIDKAHNKSKDDEGGNGNGNGRRTSENLIDLFDNMNEKLEVDESLEYVDKCLANAKILYDRKICDLESTLVLYDGITASNLDTTDDIQNIVKGAAAGGYLRRSAWKKASLWQYACTNLNVHMVTSKLILDEELIHGAEAIKRNQASIAARGSNYALGDIMFRPSNEISNRNSSVDSARPSAHSPEGGESSSSSSSDSRESTADAAADEEGEDDDKSIVFTPVISLGVPSAHGMKFKEGGIRRIFREAGFTTTDQRIFWMKSVQNSSLSCKKLFTLAEERGEVAQLKKLLHMEKSPTNEEWLQLHGQVGIYTRRLDLATRIEISFSQIVGFCCAALRTIINLATLQPESRYFSVLIVSLKAGFLAPLQSLLSTSGNEEGMIEDMDGAVLFLRGMKVNILREKRKPGATLPESVVDINRMKGLQGDMYVNLYVTDEEADVVQSACNYWVNLQETEGEQPPVPPTTEGRDGEGDSISRSTTGTTRSSAPPPPAAAAQHDTRYSSVAELSLPEMSLPSYVATFSVVSVFMTQGVNEMQSAVNMAGHMNLGMSDLHLQCDCNKENLSMLKDYVGSVIKHYMIMTNSGNQAYEGRRWTTETAVHLEHLEESVHQMEMHLDQKHVSILTNYAYLCRRVSGTVGILCKSGKDRTGMSTTLELVRGLARDAHLIHGEKAVQTLREYGARRVNVWANTGQSKFAFNSIQRSCLPPCFKPPLNTFSGKVAS
jgi:hypothetical protein